MYKNRRGNLAKRVLSASGLPQKPVADSTTSGAGSSLEQTEDMPWGSRQARGGVDVPEESLIHGNRIVFNIVWREISNKKHKVWKDDGTLEVHTGTKRAALKNHTGEFMGSVVVDKLDELVEGLQMVIGNKEIELQEQIKNENEYWSVHKQQVLNRCWGEEEWTPEEPSAKKPKADFVFRPNLVLKKPDVPRNALANGRTQKYARNMSKTVEPLVLARPEGEYLQVLNVHQRPVSDVCVPESLLQHLRPHQREGVSFIYSCLMGLRQKDHFGCILADEMGLGKTLQCLTAAYTMLRTGPFAGESVIQRVLIVTPSSLTRNWSNEIAKWLQTERIYAFVADGKRKLSSYSQQKHEPFVIVSYEMLGANMEAFSQLKFDLLICDEGHRLKNPTTKAYITLCDLNIPRRLLLTGTPVQNDLKEYFALADFVNPGILGTYQEFSARFVQPLERNQDPEASLEIREIAAALSAELNKISAQFMLRRLQEVNCQYLPKKREYICFVRPSELQQLMLQKALDIYERSKETLLKELTPLQIITVLLKICNHPSLVSRTKNPNKLTGSLERFLDNWDEIGPFDSAKLELVQNFLVATAVEKREKCVLVSNHTKTLNMLQGLCDHLNLKCLRLDGSTTAADRNQNVKNFNAPTDEAENNPLIFLLSAKAGGVGLNLIGASRLILYDNDWNPATDAQAIARIWRDGQQRDVQIYRFVTAGCIEEKIFQRQVAKVTLGDVVMQAGDSKGLASVKFSAEQLLDLFTLQSDFSTCETHQSLNCNCSGDGTNTHGNAEGTQINNLMQWAHYGPPYDEAFLEEAHLQDFSEHLVYIFSCEAAANSIK